jgi:hypothetical protein
MNKVCDLNKSFSFFAFLPMYFAMTIRTECFKIFKRMILSILIYMMNAKNFYIFILTTITNNFSMIANRFSKTSNHIRIVRFQSSVEKIRTMGRTKHFCFRLKINPSNNQFITKLTSSSLYTRFRTVFTVFFVIPSLVRLSASFANLIKLNFPISFPSANFRTIQFANEFTSIFPWENILATQTFIHKKPQIKGVLCL